MTDESTTGTVAPVEAVDSATATDVAINNATVDKVVPPAIDNANLPGDYALPRNTPGRLPADGDPAKAFNPAALPTATPALFNPVEGEVDKTVPYDDQAMVGNLKQADLLRVADGIQEESELVRMYPIAHDGTKMNELANRLAELSARLIGYAKPDADVQNTATETPSLPDAPKGAVTAESGAV